MLPLPGVALLLAAALSVAAPPEGTAADGVTRRTIPGDASVVSVETGSGNVDVSVPRGFGGSVHMETGSGSIETSVPMEIRKRDKNELSGTIGDGRGKVSLETGSGTIALRSGGR